VTVDLLDANVLIALVVADHIHHDAAEAWLAHEAGEIATCPTTQGALVRFLVREGVAATSAATTVSAVQALDRHRFWPDDLGLDAVDLAAVVGHRQVTDAYLAALARARGGRLATFDRGLAGTHPDVALLLER
jgi:toxin-antitoxin system PIN domain toxin